MIDTRSLPQHNGPWTAEQIADLALRVLDQQQKYFKSRTLRDLGASKALEQELRKVATQVLASTKQPSLFDGETE